VLELFRGGDVANHPRGSAKLDQILDELDRAARESSRTITIDELSR
jgi:hypothetical protein